MPVGGLPNIQRGQTISAQFLRDIVSRVIRSITGGRGIQVDYLSGRVVISSTQPFVRRGKSGGSGMSNVYTAETKAELDEIMPDNSIGITTGTYKRAYVKLGNIMYCFTHFETS